MEALEELRIEGVVGTDTLLTMFCWRLFPTIIFLLALAFLSYTLYIAYIHQRFAHLPGPPYFSFYFGHLMQLKAYRDEGHYVSKLFLQWAEEYGPCFKLYIFHRCLISLNGTNMVKEILTKSKYIKAPDTYRSLFSVCGLRFLGNGVLTETNHAKWYQRRMILNPAFHKKYLRMFMTQFNEVGDEWTSVLSGHADGQSIISMDELIRRITLEAVSYIAFNFKMNAMEGDFNPYNTSILYILAAFSKTMRDPLFQYRPSEKDLRNRVRESIKFLRSEFGRNRLADRLVKMKSGEPVPEDILTYIIRTRELIPELEEEDLLDDMLTLFIAGQETTANVLAFLFIEAGRHPDVILKLQQEIDSVLEGRSFIDYDDLSRLEYTGAVFKETLRLYPPASGTARYIQDETTIDGIHIPAKSNVVFSFFVIHRLNRNWENPEEFRPERFLNKEAKHLFTYMPFSVGHRACIGQQFAMIESKVLLCKFFQKFTFTLDPDQTCDILETTSLRPKYGTKLILSHR